MDDTETFLARLGLCNDAATDSSSIRRAYVRELKQIDQETDAASFQDPIAVTADGSGTWTPQGAIVAPQ